MKYFIYCQRTDKLALINESIFNGLLTKYFTDKPNGYEFCKRQVNDNSTIYDFRNGNDKEKILIGKMED